MGTQVSMFEYDPLVPRDRRRLRLLALLDRLPLRYGSRLANRVQQRWHASN